MQVQIDGESVGALWDGLRRELDVLAPPEGIPDAVLEVLRGLFCDLILHFPHDVVEGVALPASGAGEHALGLRISGAFKRKIAACAFDLFGIGHKPLHHELH